MDSFLNVVSKPKTLREAMALLGVCPKCGNELNFVGAMHADGCISLYGRCENSRCHNRDHSYATGITVYINDISEYDLDNLENINHEDF